jgi:BMFP domain-containing protein YqiC
MSRETELAAVREQVSILAEQVFSLVDVITRQTEAGADTAVAARNKMDILENLMWKLHARQTRLKNLLH